MEGLVQERRRRLPMRHCALCGQRKAVLQLTQVQGRWLCAPCYREHVVPARRPPAAAGDRDDGEGRLAATAGPGSRQPPDPELLWTLRVVDAGFRYGGLALRVVVYGVLYALAQSSPLGGHLMGGFLLADGVTWMLRALFDLRFHRPAVVAETLLFGVLFYLWVQTGWSFPDEPADRAVLGLAALGTFAVKIGTVAQALAHR